jgi:hypothetical protein
VAHHDWGPSWHGYVDADVEVTAVMAMPMRHLDEHVASDDTGIKQFQPPDPVTDLLFEGFVMCEVAERNLDGNECHGELLLPLGA